MCGFQCSARIALLGDVVAHTADFHQFAFTIKNRTVGPGNPHPLAIFAHILVDIGAVVFQVAEDGFYHLAEVAVSHTFQLWHDGANHMLADQFTRSKAEKILGKGIHEQDMALWAHVQDQTACAFNQRSIMSFTFFERVFRQLALVDIAAHYHYCARIVLRIAYQ